MPEQDDLTTTESTEEDDHLLEDDGDSFWVIQRFVWGAIKTLLLLGAIGLVLWLIWGNENFKLPAINIKLPSIERPKDTKPEQPKPSKQDPSENFRQEPAGSLPKIMNYSTSKPLRVKNPRQLSDLSWSAAKWNLWVHTQSQANKGTQSTSNNTGSGIPYTVSTSGQTTKESVKWLRDAEKFFAVKPLNWVTGDNPSKREAELNRMIRTIDYLIKRSTTLKSALRIEMAQYRQAATTEQSQISTAEDRINRELDKLQGEELSTFMRQKIMAENQKFSAETESWLRSSLLQKIETYELPLKNIKQNAQTNRQAIIHNIKVTNFPNDPFRRIEAR